MDPASLMAGSNMPKEVTGGNAGPATSGSNGQFWTDMTNGDFIVGGSKNGTLTTMLIVGGLGAVVWLFLRK